MDFTIRRAAMPLIGEDPFGAEFMALFDEWQAAGSPFHGLPPMNTAELTYPEAIGRRGVHVFGSDRFRRDAAAQEQARAARARRGPPA